MAKLPSCKTNAKNAIDVLLSLNNALDVAHRTTF